MYSQVALIDDVATDSELKSSDSSPQRQWYLDYLKCFLTALVIFHHVIYIHTFGWYPVFLPKPSDYPDSIYSIGGLLLSLNQSYFMGLFFFISGYLITSSYNWRGPKLFLKSTCQRLLIPLAIVELILQPALFVLATKLYESSSSSVYDILVYYITTYQGIGGNPMWFLVLLFMFETIYVLIRAVGVPIHPRLGIYSNELVMLCIVALIGVLSIASSLLRIVFPIGYFLPTIFTGFQIAYFGQYIISYIFGILVSRSNALTLIPSHLLLILLPLSAFAFIFLVLVKIFFPFEMYASGCNILQFVHTFYEQAFAASFSATLLILCRDYFNIAPNNFVGFVLKARFAAYVIHQVVVSCLAMLLNDWKVNMAWKILLETAVSILLSWGLGECWRRVPVLGRSC